MLTKKHLLLTIGAVTAVSAAAVTLKAVQQTRKKTAAMQSRWHIITVERPLSNVAIDADELQPLLNLGNAVEITITAAPGDRGTEIAARLTDASKTSPASAIQTLAQLRLAMRSTQQLLETGEILSTDTSSTHKTLLNLPLRFATRHAREGGRL